ncbi:GtrA family protein [Photobacterium sagamiensis]|uniref:GtrA family protein n=1 Tax=Photobacterium sagamiensis TaxID=2910241 RepID=UPI003D133AAF
MKIKLIRFAFVGGIGFLVDVVTMALLSLFIPLIPARALAFWVAASSNWWWNRRITFKNSDTNKPIKQWTRFLCVSCLGFVPNWGCYWWLMQLVDTATIQVSLEALFGASTGKAESYQAETIIRIAASAWPFIAMVPGILLGMLTNFMLAERWVFRPAAV